MWVYVLVGVFFLFALYKERQALGCPDWPNGADCDNQNGKAVRGTKVTPDMSTHQILDAIDYAAKFQDRWVKWRATFMIALLATIVAIYIMYNRVPTEQELVVYTVVFVLTVTLSNSFYRFHLTDHVTNHVSEGVEILRSRQKTDNYR